MGARPERQRSLVAMASQQSVSIKCVSVTSTEPVHYGFSGLLPAVGECDSDAARCYRKRASCTVDFSEMNKD